MKLKKDKLIEALPIKDYVAAVSVGIAGGALCLDLNYEEDSNAEVDMNIVMTGKGRFIEVQGTAEKDAFSKKDMDDLILLAQKGINDLIVQQKKILKINF
jgi:ribonuclease PH